MKLMIRYKVAAREGAHARRKIRIDLPMRPRRRVSEVIVDSLSHGTGTGLFSASQMFLTTSMINASHAW